MIRPVQEKLVGILPDLEKHFVIQTHLVLQHLPQHLKKSGPSPGKTEFTNTRRSLWAGCMEGRRLKVNSIRSSQLSLSDSSLLLLDPGLTGSSSSSELDESSNIWRFGRQFGSMRGRRTEQKIFLQMTYYRHTDQTDGEY